MFEDFELGNQDALKNFQVDASQVKLLITAAASFGFQGALLSWLLERWMPSRDDLGESLYQAASGGQTGTIRQLLVYGVDPNSELGAPEHG